MKGPSIIDSCLCRHGCKRQKLFNQDINTLKRPDVFIKLLADKIKNSKEPDTLNSSAIPLNKNYLQRLIGVVQGQMNDSLICELSKFDKDSDSLGYNRQWMNFDGTQNLKASVVSKIENDTQKGKKVKSPPEINDIIEHASKVYEVDPVLIKSVIRAESDFDADATSSKGAMGLMQLMPETAKELGVKNCYNPVENIMAGTRYLKSLLNRYNGNVELALAAYNWGMGNVEKHPDRLPKETKTYIARISGYLRKEMS